MKLSDLQKPEPLYLADAVEGQPRPVIFVRFAPTEFTEKQEALQEQERARLGLGPSDALPFASVARINREAFLGTYVSGWRNLENEDGSPLADRDESGLLHIANGSKILSSQEVDSLLGEKIKEIMATRGAAMETARGNSEAPSAVN